MWDVIGFRQLVEKFKQFGVDISGWIKDMLDKGNEIFYI